MNELSWRIHSWRASFDWFSPPNPHSFTKPFIARTTTMFTIFGATGNSGKIAAETLLEAGKKVRVFVRDPAKAATLKKQGAEVVVGNIADVSAVTQALQGASGAYVLLPPDLQSKAYLDERRAMADGLAQALKNTRVAHVVFLSSVGAQHQAGVGPIRSVGYAEGVLASLSDTRFTFIRAAYFMDNYLAMAQPMRTDGMLPVFGGGEQYPFEMVAARDIGAFAAQALLSPPQSSETVRLHAAQVYSPVDVAQVASELLNRQVQAKPLPLDAMVPSMVSHGISENVAELYRELTEAGQKGLLAYEGTERTVHAPTTLQAFLKGAL
jgi:uncharacterized protein YbjT (DUF2867 family)